MPAGALARTSTVHTSVPAVTSANDWGAPRLITDNGSRPGTLTTVYCQLPAHIGPTVTVTVVCAGSIDDRRSSATTCAPVGRPAQATAIASPNPGELGAPLGEAIRDGIGDAAADVALGVALGVSTDQPGGRCRTHAANSNSSPTSTAIRRTVPPNEMVGVPARAGDYTLLKNVNDPATVVSSPIGVAIPSSVHASSPHCTRINPRASRPDESASNGGIFPIS
jgi:hypothetical protein